MENIKKLNLPGIDFIEGTKRFYPNSSLAPYIIGYARSIDEGPIIGEMGIEKKFNNELTGTNGFVEYQKDLNGYKFPNSNEIREAFKKDIEFYRRDKQEFIERIEKKTFYEKTDVKMHVMSENEIDRYIATGEPITFDITVALTNGTTEDRDDDTILDPTTYTIYWYNNI